MDFVTASIVGGVLYDIVKLQAQSIGTELKRQLKEVVLTDKEVDMLEKFAKDLIGKEPSITKEEFIGNLQSQLTSIQVKENNGIVAGTINGGVTFNAK